MIIKDQLSNGSSIQVTLDGSGSSDPDGDELTYSWSQPSGQGISLSSANGVSTSFTAAIAGTYTFTLTVSDGELSDSATVTITVGDVNRAPIADIDVSPDADITTATQVTLDGSSSYDPDGDLITYKWSQPSEQDITLSFADINDQSIANFTVTSAGTYTFTLTVSDGLLSDSEVVTVTVGDVNRAPIAAISVSPDPDTSAITTETQVTLDGSSSYDPDGDPITSYTWSQPSGISLSSTNGVSTTFTATSAGTYTFTLTVSDGDLSGSSEVIVVVHPVTIPSDFSATAGDSEVILTWTPYSDETTYSIYRSTDPNCDPAAANVSTNCSDGAEFPGVDSGLADTGLTNGTTYYYWIEATLDGVIQRSVAPISATPQEPTTGIVATGALNDTGIDWGGDYESGNNADCSSNISAPQDCNQGRDATNDDDSDGHAGFSFTKLDSSGNPLAASATEWSCVQDNVTGLIWEVKTDDGGIHDKDNIYRWGGVSAIGYDSANREGTYYDDWDSLVNGANSTKLCGFDDWRVPDLEELRSIVDYSRTNPSIDVDYFPNTLSLSSRYWSASPDAFGSNNAWILHFESGFVYNYGRKYNNHVRLVRGGQ